jgi:hypothetical protein
MDGDIAINFKTQLHLAASDFQHRDLEHARETAAASHDYRFSTLSRQD